MYIQFKCQIHLLCYILLAVIWSRTVPLEGSTKICESACRRMFKTLYMFFTC